MKKTKLLCLNVYYAPYSFGGATIVAEKLNSFLLQKYNYEVSVITTTQNPKMVDYAVKKYATSSKTVYAINLPQNLKWEDTYQHDTFAEKVKSISKKVQPDIVHAHAIQKMGVSFLAYFQSLDIPTIVTAHDCWWFCDRLFMINNHGKYCFQAKIDPSICMYCLGFLNENQTRLKYLRSVASAVDLFLYPSKFHKNKYLENGWSAGTSEVSKNGVCFPKESFKKEQSDVVRFGFVGGPGHIKGGQLLKEAFKTLGDKISYKLYVVNAALNTGSSWENGFKQWGIPESNFEILPAYNMDTMDNFYSKIDVLLFPSQWKESFGLTVREALVRDIWVISTNGGGTTEDLREGENATIIPITNNPEPLIEAIVQCSQKDWPNYKNPYKSEIRSFEEQADELHMTYSSLLTKTGNLEFQAAHKS